MNLEIRVFSLILLDFCECEGHTLGPSDNNADLDSLDYIFTGSIRGCSAIFRGSVVNDSVVCFVW